MPRVKALRGVCVGVERHLTPGEVAECTTPRSRNYLVSIGAVEVVPDAPVKASPKPEARRSPARRSNDMLLSQASAATSTSLLDAVSAANTAAATSGAGKWLDVRPYQGEILVTLNVGAVTGTIAGKLQSGDGRQRHGRGRHHGRRVRHDGGEFVREARHRPEDGHRRLPRLRRHDRHGPVAGQRRRVGQEADRLARVLRRAPRRILRRLRGTGHAARRGGAERRHLRRRYAEPLGSYVEGRSPAVTAIAAECRPSRKARRSSSRRLPGLGVPGGTYVVRGVEPDGTGIVVLKLQEP
jgi:hypothetical protein